MPEVKILVIEDDTDLSNVIKDYLVNENYQVIQVHNGNQAVDLAKECSPTLILLDLMLPGLNGIEICKQLRAFTYCPIIIISAKSSDADKLLSLGVGADDYLTKPFSFIEMIGRIKSHIRRFTSFQTKIWQTSKQPVRVFGDLTIDPNACSIAINDKTISLTAKEFQLIDFLSSHPGQVFTKDQILDAIWGQDSYIDDNTVAVYIGRLREKIFKQHDCYLKTVWGIGYKWDETNSSY